MHIEPQSPITSSFACREIAPAPQVRPPVATESSIESLANPASAQDIEKRTLELLEQIFILRAHLEQDRSRLKNPPNPVPKATLLEVKERLETVKQLVATSLKHIQKLIDIS